MTTKKDKFTGKKGKVEIIDLKLNKETITDLVVAEAKTIQGGAIKTQTPKQPPESACARGCLSWSVNYCPKD